MAQILYRRQKQILDFIEKYIDKYNCAPTLGEIADKLAVHSLSTIHEHMATLEKKGFIRRFRGAVRGNEILGKTDNLAMVELPVLGFIAAGQPIQPFTDPEATVKVSTDLVSDKDLSFVLQVKGNSMIEEGILDGDHVVIRKQDTANNGDIVVATLKNGFATLKRVYWEKDKKRVRLQPANSQMKPIYVREVQIQGKVTGVIRRFG